MSNVTRVLPPHLLAAYRVTCYRVWAPAMELQLYVDRHDAGLAKLLHEASIDTAALLTAWNPASTPQLPDVNQAQQAVLERELRDAGIACLRGRNEPRVDSATQSPWNEDSVLALDISLDAAGELALRFGQLAYLWIDRQATPRLIATPLAAHA